MASVPHNYMIGAFVYGRIAGENAVDYLQSLDHLEPDPDFLAAEQARLYPPLTQPNGIPHTQVEYKLRRLVNPADSANDLVKVVDPEGLKEVYGATRDKVSWWPLK